MCFPCVSTHSHPKVAASFALYFSLSAIEFQHTATRRWLRTVVSGNSFDKSCFNTQPPEGGCALTNTSAMNTLWFQHTATRRWLLVIMSLPCDCPFSFNTQPPEGGCIPKNLNTSLVLWFQHTATRRWLRTMTASGAESVKFQHTATRRWLLIWRSIGSPRYNSFNTQPPEGGCQ